MFFFFFSQCYLVPKFVKKIIVDKSSIWGCRLCYGKKISFDYITYLLLSRSGHVVALQLVSSVCILLCWFNVEIV